MISPELIKIGAQVPGWLKRVRVAEPRGAKGPQAGLNYRPQFAEWADPALIKRLFHHADG